LGEHETHARTTERPALEASAKHDHALPAPRTSTHGNVKESQPSPFGDAYSVARRLELPSSDDSLTSGAFGETIR